MINIPSLPREWKCSFEIHNSQVLNQRLVNAVKDQKEKIVKDVLQMKADPNVTLDTSSLLAEACSLGNASIADSLISHGAKLNHPSPLRAAIDKGHISVVTSLIQSGMKVNQTFGNKKQRPLEKAISKRKTHCVYSLLIAGAKVNFINPITETTPLIKACRTGQYEIVSLLLTARADPNLCTNTSPLIEGASNPKIVRILLEHKAAADWTISKGKRVATQAIHEAARSGAAESAWLLLLAGVSPFSLDVKYRMPYDIAIEHLQSKNLEPRDEAKYQETAKVLMLPKPLKGYDPCFIFGEYK